MKPDKSWVDAWWVGLIVPGVAGGVLGTMILIGAMQEKAARAAASPPEDEKEWETSWKMRGGLKVFVLHDKERAVTCWMLDEAPRSLTCLPDVSINRDFILVK